MRRFAAALATVVLSAVLVAAPSLSASAAGPDPVIPLPYTPAQVSSVLSGFADGSKVSEAYLKAYLLAYNAARNAGQSSTAASAAAIAATPKPVTGPGLLARAGTPLVAFQAGWAIGQGGLALYAVTTGSDYQTVVCSQPDWYQSVNTFILLSMGPTCAPPFTYPNGDRAAVGTFPSGASFNQYLSLNGGNQWPVACGPPGSAPAGSTYYGRLSGGTWLASSTAGSYGYGCGSSGATRQLIVSGSSGHYGQSFTSFERRANTGGAVLETATMARPNPTRTIGCTVTHSLGTTSRTALSGGYGEDSGIPHAKISEACKSAWDARPSGSIPSKISVDSTDDVGAKTTISEQNVNSGAVPAEMQPGGGGLVLEKVAGAGTQSCMDWVADCAEWWEQTSNGTVTGLYRCLFGGAEVSLSQCAPYEHTFKSQTATPTITDPLTGNPTEWASSPSPGNSISPGVGPGVGVSPADVCFTDGWASVANPIDWVLVPVKCALVWAFVPRVGNVEGAVSALGDAAGSVASVDPLLALIDTLPASGGCAGIPVSLTFFGQTATGTFLGACDGFGRTAATVVNGLLTLAICTGALVAVTRYAAAVFGFVGPGGGFDQQMYSNHMMARSAARSD